MNNAKDDPKKATSPKSQSRKAKEDCAKQEDPFLRAPNEDDDGYDPYSDRPIKEDMWEEDPWR